jgi:hypothetical protein
MVSCTSTCAASRRRPWTHDVLGRLLRALGVDGQAIPDGADERVDLYRSLMADRRTLVLLDNAADEAQVRPLLPAGAGNAVLVTSRTRLTGLAGTEVIDLDVLPPEQAVELLGKIAGADRVAREPAAAQVIAALCGYLPLALRIAGVRLAAKPHWQLQRLAHRLAEHQRRLDELTTGDLEVRASVGMSYHGLGETEQRAVRLLGLLEVPDFASWMLAAMLDISAADAEEVADHLAHAQLLDTIGDDATGQLRYRFHDLVRLYARERLAAEETLATRRAPHCSEHCRLISIALMLRSDSCASAHLNCPARPHLHSRLILMASWRRHTSGWRPSTRDWR